MGLEMDKLQRLIVPAVAFILIAVVVLFFVHGNTPSSTEKVSDGVHYLKTLEEQDVQTVENILASQRQAKIQAEKDETMRKVESGEIDVWSLFTDYVLMGDSRGVGFSYYGFMPESRVIAGGGWTIRDIAYYMDQLRALNPTAIFLCFGLNDTSIGHWDTPEPYAAEYLEVVRGLQAEFPNCTVYVNSILPARDPAFATAEKWHEIPEYSAAVEKMCQENGIPFVNNDSIAEKYSYLWDEDGIHLQKEFYPMWAANMIMTMYNTEPQATATSYKASGENTDSETDSAPGEGTDADSDGESGTEDNSGTDDNQTMDEGDW